MASVYATSSGNWSDTAIWYTGSVAYNQVPLPGDVVYANGRTVTIDQNFNVASINTTALAPAVAGGTFNITGSVTITGSIGTGLTNCVTCTAPTGSTVRISGSIAGSSTTTSIYGFVHNGTGDVIVTGNINCGTTSAIGFVNNTSGSLTVNGILNSTTANNREPVANNSTGAITVNGALYGSSNGNFAFGCIRTVGTGPITINGVIYHDNAWFAALVISTNCVVNINGTTSGITGTAMSISATSASVTFNGNFSGGSAGTTPPITSTNTSTLNFIGNLTGGGATSAAAVNLTGGSFTTITGNVIASSLSHAIQSSAATATNTVNGNLISSATGTGIFPFYTTRLRVNPTAAQTFSIMNSSNALRTFATANAVTGMPSGSDVRYNTTYGITNELTGSLRVPLPQYVSQGVLVDNTSGSAVLTAADFLSAISSSSDPLAIRLRNVATVDTVGGQIAAFTP